MKKFSVYSLFFLLFSFSLNAQWISVDKNKEPYTLPTVQLLSDDNFSSVIKIELAGFELSQFTADNKTYNSINILDGSVTTETGSPEIPHLSALIAVPDEAGISVEIIESQDTKIFKNIYAVVCFIVSCKLT